MEQSQSSNGQQGQKEEQKKPGRRQKETQEQKLAKIEIKSSEQVRLNAVFDQFCAYEEEPSSDEDSKEKLYKKKIEERANAKKMKQPKSTFVSQTMKKTQKKTAKKFKEDDDDQEQKEKEKAHKKKFSFKALRKTIRNLCDEYAKDEIEQMIWEVDENSDGYVSEKEFTDMYKKCIVDEKEEEAKKLFYLVQFLMYDKENKHYITVEDTLEILCARNQAQMDANIDAIFDIEVKDPKTGKVKKMKKEQMTYLEYADRMHKMSMKKRNEISNRKKLFCQRLKEEAVANGGKKY